MKQSTGEQAVFRDRIDAAHQLAARLADLALEHPLVLAIPRGGVPMGAVLAEALEGDLDVALVHKLGAPGHAEFAVGAIDEHGTVQGADAIERRYGRAYLERETAGQLAVLRERRRQYAPVRPPLDPAGRVVVIVDDGSATGATMEAALRLVRARAPRRLIAALGAAPPDVVSRLERIADRVECIETTAAFGAVGQFYADFTQVDDGEVVRLLREASRHPPRPS